MKKNKKPIREKVVLEIQNPLQDKSQMDSWDEAYRQINKISFQENFRALIGHYKPSVQTSQIV